MSHDYVLATGTPERERLRLLQEVYGPVTESTLAAAGLRPGMRVVEMGCGSGEMACWLAAQVGPGGSVVGVDQSAAQLDVARRLAAERGLRNVTFAVGEATAPGLPPATFDLAYCRLVLMHLPDPTAGVRALHDLVRPGGAVVAVEMDLTRYLCDPPSALVDRFFALNVAVGDARGVHFRLASSLHRAFDAVGLTDVAATAALPLLRTGAAKHLIRLTFEELAPALVAGTLATDDEVARIAAELQRTADDPHTLLGMPLVVAVRGRRGT